MIYHVLPGDAQVDGFRSTGIEGQMLVCREALVEGDVSGNTLDEFFNNRAAFLNQTPDEDPAVYNANVASQFRQLLNVSERDEVNLWFEYELFCAVNMWFCLSLLLDSDAQVYRVSPVHLSYEDRWDGFGGANSVVLKECFDKRVKLDRSDIKLGSELWNAFRRKDHEAIINLTSQPVAAFPYLDEVGRAAAEIDSRPLAIVAEIEHEGINNFSEIFAEFRRRAGVFGFGDTQVKNLLSETI
jgi:hypothetical protein